MDNYKQDFSDYTVIDSNPITGTRTVAKHFIANVFMWMFVALGISAFFTVLYGTNQSLFEELYITTEQGLLRPSIWGWMVTFAPLAFVMLMSFGINRLSASTLMFVFILYAAVTGISLSYIIMIYTPGSVLGCFTAASAMFGIMAVMGYTTEKDLTSFGSLLMMGLMGMIVAIVINIFLQSDRLGYIISIAGVAIFTGLTAYDVQVLKRIGAGIEYEGTSAHDTKKLAIMGALRLYLDFINLFLMLLRLFGSRRN